MTEPIRVLQVMASLDRGGAEAVVMDWLRRIDRTQVVFDFVVDEGGPYAFEQEAIELGSKIIRAPVFRGWNAWAYAWWWRRSLSRHPEWQCIHAHHTVPGLIYLTIARSLGRVTVAHSHTVGRLQTPVGFMRAMLWWPLRFIAEWHLACARSAGEWMFGRSASVRVIPNGIDVARFAFDPVERLQLRRKLGFEDAFLVGHVGRLSLPKNHARILKVFSALAQQEPRARLLLVGDGPLRGEIERRILALGLEDKVLLAGVRPDIPALLSAMDVLLFPSHNEGLPVTLVEAQASGLPSVVSAAVTSEVAVTDLVTYVSLDQPDDVWVSELLKAANHQSRRSRSDEIRAAGFEATEVAAAMQQYYLDLLRGDPASELRFSGS